MRERGQGTQLCTFFFYFARAERERGRYAKEQILTDLKLAGNGGCNLLTHPQMYKYSTTVLKVKESVLFCYIGCNEIKRISLPLLDLILSLVWRFKNSSYGHNQIKHVICEENQCLYKATNHENVNVITNCWDNGRQTGRALVSALCYSPENHRLAMSNNTFCPGSIAGLS